MDTPAPKTLSNYELNVRMLGVNERIATALERIDRTLVDVHASSMATSGHIAHLDPNFSGDDDGRA